MAILKKIAIPILLAAVFLNCGCSKKEHASERKGNQIAEEIIPDLTIDPDLTFISMPATPAPSIAATPIPEASTVQFDPIPDMTAQSIAAQQTQQPAASPSPTTSPTISPSPAPDPSTQLVNGIPAELKPSTQMAFEELVGDDGNYEEPASRPPTGTYWLEIDVGNNVAIVRDANNMIVRMMLCTTGRSGTRTPTGEFKVGKRRERFGYFDEFECYAQYWTQVTDAIFIHSVLYDEKDAKTLTRSSYRNLGKSSSHGCIRMTVPDAKWVYENFDVGSRISIVDKAKDEYLTSQLALPEMPKRGK